MPTSRDFRTSDIVIQKMKLYAMSAKWNMQPTSKEVLLHEINSLRAATEHEIGTYGGGLDTYGVLSNMLGIQILWLNLTTPKTFVLYPGGLECNQKKLSMNDLRATMGRLSAENVKFVVVEYNGSGHFAGYIPRHPMRLSLDVLDFLGLSKL